MPPAKQTRSHTGCWTCKRRRRKCDEERPSCKACFLLGVACEGYGTRLKWGSGVASRGSLAGALEPVPDRAPTHTKGRKRDLLKDTTHQTTDHHGVHAPTPSSMASPGSSEASPASDKFRSRELRKESLFMEFVTTGIKSLQSTRLEASPSARILVELSKNSKSVVDICAACQAYLSYGANDTFFDYYNEVLAQLRLDLDDPERQQDDGTPVTILLLCSIGMLQGTPWTVHLRGLEKLLDARAQLFPTMRPSAYFVQAIEVMAVMDVDAFVIGRKSPTMNLWRRYRAGELFPLEEAPDEVELGSGVPKSLIDLIDFKSPDTSAEQALWLWPGLEGTFLQCHLWDAYRYAAMLDIRQKRRKTEGVLHLEGRSSKAESSIPVPNDTVVITRGLSSLDAIYNGAAKHQSVDWALLNALLYPLYIFAMEILSNRQYEKWYPLVAEWFRSEIERDRCASTHLAWDVIQDVLEAQKQGLACTPDQVASLTGNEVSLL